MWDKFLDGFAKTILVVTWIAVWSFVAVSACIIFWHVYVTAGLAPVLGIGGLVVFVWLLFWAIGRDSRASGW